MDRQYDGALFLADVTEKIKTRLEEIDRSLAEGQQEIENMHEYYWENYTEMDQYGYEDYDNQQALLHQVNANQEKWMQKHRYEKMIASPFFGRVDFICEGEMEPYYIGIGNFAPRLVIYALSDFLIMILSWLVKQSLRAFLFQEVQL